MLSMVPFPFFIQREWSTLYPWVVLFCFLSSPKKHCMLKLCNLRRGHNEWFISKRRVNGWGVGVGSMWRTVQYIGVSNNQSTFTTPEPKRAGEGLEIERIWVELLTFDLWLVGRTQQTSGISIKGESGTKGTLNTLSFPSFLLLLSISQT